MDYSKDILHFADSLISHYARFSKEDGCYNLYFSNISSFDLNEFASLLMKTDLSWASESISSENLHYDKKMLPSLINFLQNSTDRDAKIEFVDAWKEGVTFYFEEAMKNILDERLEIYSQDKGHTFKDEERTSKYIDTENRTWA